MALTSFECPGCGQRFDWSPQLAGRKLTCACGQTINVPGSSEPATRECALDDQKPPGHVWLDSTGQEISPPAPVHPLAYARQPPPIQSDALSELITARRRDIHVPTALLSLGLTVLLLLLAALIRDGRPPIRLVGNLTLRLGWDLGFTFIAFLLIASLIDVSLGAIHVAALKIGAVAVARFSIWAVFGMTIPHVGGDLVGFVLSLFALLWMLSYLFELDFRDTIFAATIITLIRWVSYFGLWKILP